MVKLKVKKRDGSALLGEMSIGKQTVLTPNILFPLTDRYKTPDFADIILTTEEKKEGKTSLRIYKPDSEKQKTEGKIDISHHFFYPKDMPTELHTETVINHPKNGECIVLPADKKAISKETLQNFSFFVVANALQLYKKTDQLLEYVINLREKIGEEKIIYLPAVGNPDNLALLSYCGINLFDASSAIIAAEKKQMFTQNGVKPIEEMGESTCSCPICQKHKNNFQQISKKDILMHNYHTLYNEIKTVRNAIRQNTLRDLVEVKTKNSHLATTILRKIDFNHQPYLEKHIPVSDSKKLNANTLESFYRTEIKRFQKRVIERYRKPEHKRILLLLPCSAKKPYSFSKSHHFFQKQLFSTTNPYIFHELVITSPLGLVPRELELVYPANSYDIPVTGFWDENEKRLVEEMLTAYLEKNHYDKIIAHIPKNITSFLKDIIPNMEVTCLDHPTDKESLDELQKTLRQYEEEYEHVDKNDGKREVLKGLSRYQFGDMVTEKLFENTAVKGRYPYLKLFEKNHQLGMMSPERNYISLTLEGGKKIAEINKYWIKIADDFNLKGSVFAPGVIEADEDIRVGDEVLVFQKDEFIAVGKAMMNGEQMENNGFGEAVKTRHIK
ncbi:MAG: archaeosine synthase subunit alpha [Candidatus Thermoplasmatota archaeon]